MKLIGTIVFGTLLFHSVSFAQIEMVNRNDLLQEKNIHSAVPIGIADMNGDGLDDIVTLDVGRRLMIQYQTPDPSRPFVRYDITRTLDNAEQNDILIADFNNDGANDILASGTYDRIKVIYAIPNTYEFQIVHITASFFSQGASTGDFNHDGWVDAVLLNDNGANYTLLNDGTGNLVIADLFDWNTVPSSDNSGNYGSVYTDFDMDGDLDFYIAKCRQGVNNPADPRRINVLHENDGNGNYVENAAQYGLASGHQTWTADFGDMDNDGDLDCFMTQHNVISELYENINNDTFVNITAEAGLDIPGIPLQGMFRDFDNDGYQDILVSGDRVDFYRNNGDKTFTFQTTFGSVVFGAYGLGDLNHDGFTDVYASRVMPFNNPDLLREDILYLTTPNANNWLSLKLRNGAANPSAIGAMAVLYGEWGTQIREVRGGEQYGVSNSHHMVFGLGEATAYDSLVIRWPDGTREHFDGLQINLHHVLNKGGCNHILGQSTEYGLLEILCDNDSIELTSGWGGIEHSITWSNGATVDTIQVSEPGLYFPIISGGFNPCPFQYLPIEIAADPDTVRPTISYQGMNTLCRGDIATLNLPAALGYAWSNGDTTQSVDVTSSGSYFAEVQGYCKVQHSDTIVFDFHVPVEPIGDPDTFLLGESAELVASGDSIAWYADADGLVLLGTGDSLVLADLTETTVVYAQNLSPIAGADFGVGPVTQTGSTKYNATFVNGGLIFTVEEPLILHQVTIYTDTVGRRVIEITGDGYFFEKEVELIAGTNVVDLDADLVPGDYTISTNTDVNITEFGVNSPYLWRSSDNVLYPYQEPGILTITNSTYGEDFYYYFYDWKFSTKPRYCTSVLVPVTAFFDMGVGTDPVSIGSLSVSPNPTNGSLIIELPSPGNAVIDMLTMDGRLIRQFDLDHQKVEKAELQIADLQAGMYWLRLRQNGVVYVGKVVRL